MTVFILPTPSKRFKTLLAGAVSLVSRDPMFRCSGRTIELNTSLERSWSTRLISVGLVVNRGIFDELEQVIDCAARSVNRFP